MNPKFILLILLQSVLNIGGTALVKSRVVGFTASKPIEYFHLLFNLQLVAGVTCIGMGFIVMMVILREVRFSVLIPIAASVSFITSSFIGYYFFNEPITLKMLLSFAIILCGIYLLTN